MTVLSNRALNRATLARQGLLEHRPWPLVEAVSNLVGLQAQEPPDPYLALWSRIDGFDPVALGQLIEDRALVRIVVMRGTIHLVTAEDAHGLRPLMQPTMDQEERLHPDTKQVADLTPAERSDVLAQGRRWLAESPRTPTELRRLFAEARPDRHAPGLAYLCRTAMPLVQVPPRGVWGQTGQVRLAHLQEWAGPPPQQLPTIDDIALRYFRAFGPATPGDLAAWCRLKAMREVVDRIRDRLVVVHDERGRQLYDAPDGPRPPEDTPAPVRILPEYDNVLLSHQDRSRFFAGDERPPAPSQAVRIKGTVLHDGCVCATWRWDGDDLVVTHIRSLTKVARSEITNEAARVMAFLGRSGDIRLQPSSA